MFGWFKRKAEAPSTGSQWQVAAQWGARTRWISHVTDFWGDPSNEWKPKPGLELVKRPEFSVLEFAPCDRRDHYTYLTAGLSLAPQTPFGPMPHLEFVAYAQTAEPRIAQLLFMLSNDVASAMSHETSFKAFDLWGAEFCGLRDFMLVPAQEEAELLDFPNLNKRKEDARYLLATTGELTGQMRLDILQLVPLTPEQWRTATDHGTQALLSQIHWPTQPKTYGWAALQAPTP